MEKPAASSRPIGRSARWRWARRRRACWREGNSQSAVFLGQLYETGKGVPIDYGQAAQLYQRAALRGDVEGQIQLSGLYRVGRGVKQDLLMAHMWAIVAANNANGEMIERALSNKNQFSRQLTAGQMIAAQEMAEICEETNLKTCDRVVVKATNPWPPIAILDRAADAECKIKDLLVQGENKAAERARAAADEKQKSIDNDAADANAAQDKRKAGKSELFFHTYKWRWKPTNVSRMTHATKLCHRIINGVVLATPRRRGMLGQAVSVDVVWPTPNPRFSVALSIRLFRQNRTGIKLFCHDL
jgi:TPR repeat protein